MFRFTIRDVLWLMVGLGVGWWIDHRRQAAVIYELKKPQPGFDIRLMESLQKPGAAEPNP
jgi:hypothetical protein